VVSVHLAVSFAFFWAKASRPEPFDWWSLDRFLAVAGATSIVIVAGSLYKMWQLSDGGRKVAELLGGRPIDPNTADPKERRVLNVVEEMALASGLPVPTVYLLEREQGINAFAAGFAPQDAVIGVTRGTVEILNRDELQGVIAHEFSHVFHGDMSLNLRLMGVLHGILLIALIGYFLLRTTARTGSSSRKGGGLAAVAGLGLLLLVIGYVGVFFGRLIKSAVSRQREFLGDASAVQYTRNPLGIAGALKKIGGLSMGSLIMSPHAEQASHFFFSDGKLGKVRASFAGITHFDFLATHPPLAERIRRVDPGWDGLYPEVEPPSSAAPAREPEAAKDRGKREELFQLLPAALTGLVGTLDQTHVDYARGLLARIPERVNEAARDPGGARALVLALLSARDSTVKEKQVERLRSSGDEHLVREILELSPLLETCPREVRLPLVDLALPALRRLSPRQHRSFMDSVTDFIGADRQIDLFEYTLSHVLQRHLAPSFERTRPPAVTYYSLAPLRRECSVVLSAVAHTGTRDAAGAEKAFACGAKELAGLTLDLVSRNDAGLVSLRDALAKLERAAPRLKKDVMRALVAAIAEDGKVTVSEGEVLRAIADALGLPLPPFLPGQDLA
jgi:Zn-dependent protease with chaperone function